MIRGAALKYLKIVYIVLICAVLAAPLLLLPFADNTSAEKRKLSAFPSLVDEDGFNLEFPSEVDTWLSEHFPFRSQLISVNNYLKASLFKTSDEEQVVVGKENWLYFSETLPDYFGDNCLSDLQLQKLLTTVSLMQEYTENNGAKFVFTVAPNKNTVYPAYMPDRYRRTEKPTNLQRLTSALKPAAYFADLYAAVTTDTNERLYHARDSHWNALGALHGYREIMRAAGRDTAMFDNAAYTWETNWRGDLDDMIFPALDIKDTQAVFNVDWSYTFTSNYHSEEDIFITTENEGGEGALLMFRDSFGNALLPFMAQSFKRAAFSRATPYDLRNVVDYDTVVVEIVERNLANLLKTAPLMPALQRQETDVQPATDAFVKIRQKDDFVHVYGTLKDDTANVYLELSKDGETVIVQAFPILESELLGETADINGFSVYLPQEYANHTITVKIGKDV